MMQKKIALKLSVLGIFLAPMFLNGMTTPPPSEQPILSGATDLYPSFMKERLSNGGTVPLSTTSQLHADFQAGMTVMQAVNKIARMSFDLNLSPDQTQEAYKEFILWLTGDDKNNDAPGLYSPILDKYHKMLFDPVAVDQLAARWTNEIFSANNTKPVIPPVKPASVNKSSVDAAILNQMYADFNNQDINNWSDSSEDYVLYVELVFTPNSKKRDISKYLSEMELYDQKQCLEVSKYLFSNVDKSNIPNARKKIVERNLVNFIEIAQTMIQRAKKNNEIDPSSDLLYVESQLAKVVKVVRGLNIVQQDLNIAQQSSAATKIQKTYRKHKENQRNMARKLARVVDVAKALEVASGSNR